MGILLFDRFEYGRLVTFTVTDFIGNPINLSGSGVTARFRVWNAASGTIFDKVCAIPDPVNGIVTYTIVAGDFTGSSGRFYGELEVSTGDKHFYLHSYIVFVNDDFPSGSA